MALLCLRGPALPVYGMLLMVVASTLLNVQLAMCQHLAATGWPDLLMMAVCCGLIGLCTAVWLLIRRPALPDMADYKWLLACGAAFAGSFGFMMLAVNKGISLGDFASLNSTNVVFAALLGRLFLKEALGLPHLVAVFASILGALLISKPAILFGSRSSDQSANALAYVFSLVSGFCDAGIYICSRRLSDADPAYLILSFEAQGAVVVFISAAFMQGGLAIEPAIEAPLAATGWLAANFMTGFVSLTAFTLASQWCPAAASAATDTATRMVVGYAVQVVLSNSPLEPLTLSGAALMLAGVVIMAMFRRAPREDAEASTPKHSEASVSAGVESGIAEVEDDESETTSIASFIASEFADAEPQGWSGALRLRRPGTVEALGKAMDANPQVIGSVSATALATVVPTMAI